MKKLNLLGLFLGLLFCTIDLFAEKPIKIACIGNSITYGAGIINREKNSYPAQLQSYLGNGYEVRNFGVSARTLLSKGDHPYIREAAFEESQKFQPDIVLIKFGTNDTKPQNWKYKDDFMTDYQRLIDSYRALESHPRIILLTPLRCFLPDGSSISAKLIVNEVRPMVEEVAWTNKLEIINLFDLFGENPASHIMPDRLHPSSVGAGMMARKIYDYLALTSSSKVYPIEQSLKLQNAKEFNFHGYQGYEFENEGMLCKVVKPSIEAAGKPWMIHTRLRGDEPQTDINLLEHGFHVIYCDIADLSGSDKAVKRWDRFYKRMVKVGFNKKVVFEGMSRDGLFVSNWIAKNPEKVVCIYDDTMAKSKMPISRFILNATGRQENMCIHPVPGNDFRPAAGWVEGADWHKVAEDIVTTLTGKHLKLLLLGNSITQVWGGTRKAITTFAGKQAMDEAIGQGTWESAGISGDRTQNLLWRLRNDNYNVCKPQNVIIAIGINNLIGGPDTPEDTAKGIIAVTDEACKQFPDSHIFLLGLFPSGKEKESEIRGKCDKVHEILKTCKFKQNIKYINPTQWFLDENGTIRDGLYGSDYIHLTKEGYKVVAGKVAQIIQ